MNSFIKIVAILLGLVGLPQGRAASSQNSALGLFEKHGDIGSVASVSHRLVDEPLEVRVMTFNIRYGTADDGPDRWESRRDTLFETIKQAGPDVIGMQEALRLQLDQIEQALDRYAEIGTGREGGTKGEYSAILYAKDRFSVEESGTFWLSSTPEVMSIDWGNANIRICTWARLVETASKRAFYLFNTHLDYRSQSGREKGARLIAQRIQARAHPDPFVLTGDFNAGEDNPAILYLKGKGTDTKEEAAPILLVDTFRVLHPADPNVGTFHSFKGTTSGPKIDFILTPSTTKVLDAAILHTNRDGRYPSDHFPVMARVQFMDD
jgi:endonuclease/exonuclease/phosphatase family metal-dependent hydrolase